MKTLYCFAAALFIAASLTPAFARTQPVPFQAQLTSSPPTLIAPLGTISIAKPTFSWTAVPTAAKYRLAIERKNSNVLIASVVVTATSWTPTSPLRTDKYEWSVTPISASNQDMTYSDEGNFMLLAPVTSSVATPTALSPSGVGSDQSIFSWTQVTGASSYVLYRNNAQGNQPELWNIPAPATSWSLPNPAWLDYGTYQWNVRAVSSAGESNWSNTLTFTFSNSNTSSSSSSCTVAQPALAPISPLGATTLTPKFTWNAITGATKYVLFIDGPKGSLLPQIVTTATWTAPANFLKPASTYWWSVWAFNSTSDLIGKGAAGRFQTP